MISFYPSAEVLVRQKLNAKYPFAEVPVFQKLNAKKTAFFLLTGKPGHGNLCPMLGQMVKIGLDV
jgi:hypothetical protein